MLASCFKRALLILHAGAKPMLLGREKIIPKFRDGY